MSTIPSQNEKSTSHANAGTDSHEAARPGGRIRRLAIPKKLLLSYFAFVVPVAMLLVFMDIQFVLDMRAVEREMGGIQYSERVLAVHGAITDFQIAGVLREMAMESEPGELEQIRAVVATAVAELSDHHDEHGVSLGLTIEDLAERDLEHIAAPVLLNEMERGLRQRQPMSVPSVNAVTEKLLLLSGAALDLTGVTQDPALDSNALVRAILVHLPDVQRIIGDAVLSLATYETNRSPANMMVLQTYGVVLTDITDRHVRSLIDLTVREDAQFHAEHPEIQDLLVREAGAFVMAAEEFGDVLAGTIPESGSALATGIRALETAQRLFVSGVEGVKTLVLDRPEYLRMWRLIAVASSAAAIVAVAVLVFWVSRSISQSVSGIIAYTRKVADGDRAARLEIHLPDDLYELYGHTRSMVGDITALAEFPRQNPNGVLSVDAEGEIIYRNPSVQRFLDENAISLEQFLPEAHTAIVKRQLSEGHGGQKIETSGDGYVLEWSYYPVPDQGVVHVYFTNITERKRAEDQLIHDSFHDGLTGLPNRALFSDRLMQTIAETQTGGTDQIAVFLLDLDRFKVINESLGHAAGDELLKMIASKLSAVAGQRATVARFGGDEFAVLLPRLNGTREALEFANRVHAAVRETIEIGGDRFNITCSIGIVFPERTDTDPQAILRDADSAMYSAKSSGKATTEVFNRAMYESALAAVRLQSELVNAPARGEIVPYYQPVVSLESGEIAGFEALARWRHPERGLVSPGEFIPLAEETGLIVEIGQTMLEQATQQACEWFRQGITGDSMFVSVNLSVRQFGHETLVRDVKDTIEKTQMRPKCLKLEITESGLMENVETSLSLLRQFKELDVTLGIDDFGTGYSSLSYLHRFPFDTLKVDQSFVGLMEQEHESREIVTNVLSLAHGLGKDAIAEGIETAAQLASLRQLGAEFGQGYYFGRPIPADETTSLLRSGPRW